MTTIGYSRRFGTLPSVSYRTTAEDNSALTTYTFASQDIGTASATRYVVVAVLVRTGTPTISSVTVGGISATSIVSQVCGASLGVAALYSVNVPTGTTASVVVTMGGAAIRARIAIWALDGLSSSGAAEATNTSTASPINLTLTPSASAVVIGAVLNAGGDSSYTWVGLTENFDAPISGGPNGSTGASVIATGGSLTITATPTASNNPGGVSASFK